MQVYGYTQDGPDIWLHDGNGVVIAMVPNGLESFFVGFDLEAALVVQDWFLHVFCPRYGLTVTPLNPFYLP